MRYSGRTVRAQRRQGWRVFVVYNTSTLSVCTVCVFCIRASSTCACITRTLWQKMRGRGREYNAETKPVKTQLTHAHSTHTLTLTIITRETCFLSANVTPTKSVRRTRIIFLEARVHHDDDDGWESVRARHAERVGVGFKCVM